LPGLADGGFSCTIETHQAKLGLLELSVKERQRVNIAVWTGGGAIAIGAPPAALGGRQGRARLASPLRAAR